MAGSSHSGGLADSHSRSAAGGGCCTRLYGCSVLGMNTQKGSFAAITQALVAVAIAVVAYFILSLGSQFSRVASFTAEAFPGMIVCVVVAIAISVLAMKRPWIGGIASAVILAAAVFATAIGWSSSLNNLPSPVDFLSMFLAGGASPAVWIVGVCGIIIARAHANVLAQASKEDRVSAL